MISSIYLPEFREDVFAQKVRDLETENIIEGKQTQYPSDHWRAIFIAIFLAIFQQLSGVNIIQIYGTELAKGFAPFLAD